VIKIMFLCTGNTCRSQMAEGFARVKGKDFVRVYSAGVKPEGIVNPYAIKIMEEIGIDISGQHSKSIDPLLLEKMDYVVTLCGDADETCPVTPPNIKRIHVAIEDPSKAEGSEKEILSAFRKTRREIEAKIQELLVDIFGKNHYGL
jgi:arsenate reductase (thioredoxin)